ncbi:IS5 family transposase [Streptomyces sp. sk2.1]|nr:IS5 family transposase [Streptomyces sp. sk2.1]
MVGPVVPLTDAQWARIEPLLPDRTPKRGGRWRGHRQVIDAIAWKFQTGSQWIHLPREYGSWKGVYTRLRNWAIDGTWERAFTALLAQADAEGDLDWVVSVDSTIVRAHQNAAGARKRGAPADEPDHHAIGRSRGGLTTKIHLAGRRGGDGASPSGPPHGNGERGATAAHSPPDPDGRRRGAHRGLSPHPLDSCAQ